MFHGIVKTKNDLNENIPAGTEGVITAFLPDMETFAVGYKAEKGLITYKATLEQFKEKVEILMIEDYLKEYVDDNVKILKQGVLVDE